MPELAEVSRIVHFIRQHLVGKTLSKAQAQHDDIVYGKVGTSAAEFQKAMQGKKIVGAGQQGKYFWITMSTPPHAVMHFGMAGWLKIKDADTYYYRSDKPADKEWPPRYWKFLLETSDEPKTEAAFVDPRRLSRIRLVDCPADDIRKHTPLKENGPDPVVDKDIVTEKWLMEKMKSKKVPIKALLLDQANISGIGNWMGYFLSPGPQTCTVVDIDPETRFYTTPRSTLSNTATRSPRIRLRDSIRRSNMSALLPSMSSQTQRSSLNTGSSSIAGAKEKRINPRFFLTGTRSLFLPSGAEQALLSLRSRRRLGLWRRMLTRAQMARRLTQNENVR